MPIHDLREYILSVLQLDPDRPLVAAISGGPDSLCLLDVLCQAKLNLVVAHFDHQLRPESSLDAAKVQAMAAERGLPFVLGQEDVAAEAFAKGLSIEEAARKARYRFLFTAARDHHAVAVVTGHTADDQAETVLMHLLRGSGLAGLKGMRVCSVLPEWDANIPLVRPLLDVWREDTLAYCREHGLTPLIDESNLDVTYFRNRLRHQLLPELESYNPRIRQGLVHTAEVLQGDYAILQDLTQEVWARCTLQAGESYVAFDAHAFQAEPLALRRSFLRLAASKLCPDLRDFDYRVVERAVDFASSAGSTDQVDLAAGLYLLREGDRFYLAGWGADLPLMEWPQMDCTGEIQFRPGARVEISPAWQMTSQVIDLNPASLPFSAQGPDPLEAWLDLESLAEQLRLRCRRPGDLFRPLGLNGHSIKLSDYFINVKVPKRARTNWPLLYSGDDLAWVPGYQPGFPFRLQPASRKALYLRLERTDQTA